VPAIVQQQVRLDVDRCLYCYDVPGLSSTGLSPTDSVVLLEARRQNLFNAIISVLLTDATLKYTQGFHDFCGAVLPVISSGDSERGCSEVTRAFLVAVGLKHLRSSLCDPNLDAAVVECSRVFRVLRTIHMQLALHLEALDVSHIACLSWVLTLFTHPLSGHKAAAVEVLDFIFASDHDYTVVLCACVIADNAALLLHIHDCGEAYKAVLSCPSVSLLHSHRLSSILHLDPRNVFLHCHMIYCFLFADVGCVCVAHSNCRLQSTHETAMD
jgi:hypothetical protein